MGETDRRTGYYVAGLDQGYPFDSGIRARDLYKAIERENAAMKMNLTITAQYELPSDPEELMADRGTTDPAEIAAGDAVIDPEILIIDVADRETIAVTVEPDWASIPQCPRCTSPSPAQHPAMQADGGEVQLCPHPWHGQPGGIVPAYDSLTATDFLVAIALQRGMGLPEAQQVAEEVKRRYRNNRHEPPLASLLVNSAEMICQHRKAGW